MAHDVLARRLALLLTKLNNGELFTLEELAIEFGTSTKTIHTFASYLAINGTPIFTIKELMNHKDIEQTMRYAKLSPDS